MVTGNNVESKVENGTVLMIENAEDQAAFLAREKEPLISFETVIVDLKKNQRV